MMKKDRFDKYNGDIVNEKIRFPYVLVIDPDGTSQRMSRNEALKRASEKFGLDLLCVAPQAELPVCKIIDYGKYRFDKQKSARKAKQNQKIIETKEIRLTTKIGEHDLLVKVKAAKGFLEDGDKVKVGVKFKGRELTHVEIGEEVLNKFISYVKDSANIDKQPALDGKWLTCILSSKIKK